MNYSRLHPCITFSLSPARCAQRQQNTECTKIHISLVVRILGYLASLSPLRSDNAVHSTFIKRNHLEEDAAIYIYNGSTLLTLTKYVIKFLHQKITSLLPQGNQIIYWTPIIFATFSRFSCSATLAG